MAARVDLRKAMATPQSEFLISEEEYLAMERTSDERHEYIDGFVFAMAGESPEHGQICMNLSRIISTQLLDTPCDARAQNTKVRSGPMPASRNKPKGLYSYPDFVVFCDNAQFLDAHKDVLVNPVVIIEVLSKSTEKFDRVEKLLLYRNWNADLTAYLLIWQTRPVIEHYARQADDQWTHHVYVGLEASFTIQSINCTLRLSDVFYRVGFPPDEVRDNEIVGQAMEEKER